MDLPAEYSTLGRSYQLRQDTETSWWILEDREDHGILIMEPSGKWVAKATVDEVLPDSYRFDTWQEALDDFLDYLR